MIRYIFAVLLATVATFVWGNVSWMVLPWHTATMKEVADPGPVMEALAEQADGPGIYVIPGWSSHEGDAMEIGERGQFYGSYRVPGPTRQMGARIAGNLLACCLLPSAVLGFILVCLKIPTFAGRLIMCLMIGLFAALIANLPNWNWWDFPLDRTFVMIADGLIYSLLAGLCLSALLGPKRVSAEE